MRKSLFLYLFVFTGLLALFLYVSSDKGLKAKDREIEQLKAKLAGLEDSAGKLSDSTQTLLMDAMDLRYFSLENNEEALSYFNDYDLENPAGYIADKLLETNEREGDNPLVPYEGMEGPVKINKIKVLNHRWIIADFSDGKHWGELFIRYELKKDLGVDFTLTDHLLYAGG